MARTLTKVLKKKFSSATEKILWEALLEEIQKINSVAQLQRLFDKFFPKDAAIFVLRRLAIARLIKERKRYREIKNILDVSGNTISVVKNIIREGNRGKNQK